MAQSKFAQLRPYKVVIALVIATICVVALAAFALGQEAKFQDVSRARAKHYAQDVDEQASSSCIGTAGSVRARCSLQ